MTVAGRISPNPVVQYLDENGDVTYAMNNDGGTPSTPGQPAVAGPISKVKVVLTAAQLNALKTTPISLIPAPGANKFIHVMEVALRLLFGTTAFTLNAGTFKVFHGPVANGKAYTADQSAILTQTNNALSIPITAALATLTDAQAINVDVEAGNDGAANYTLGDSTLECIIQYRVIGLP